MAEKTYKIDLSLGFKTFEIKFKEFEEPVYIQFNPADEDLPKRLFEAQKKIEEETKTIEAQEGEIDTELFIEQQSRLNQIIYDAIDYAFGNKISDKVFMHCSPLARVNGKLFIMEFIDGITPVIKTIVASENKKATDNMEKYYSKYAKK